MRLKSRGLRIRLLSDRGCGGHLHRRDAVPARILRVSQVERAARRAGRTLAAATPKRSVWICSPAIWPPPAPPPSKRRCATTTCARSERIAAALLEQSATSSPSRVTDAGRLGRCSRRTRQDLWIARSAPKRQRTIRRGLGGVESLGAIRNRSRPPRPARIGTSAARATGAGRAARFRPLDLDHRRRRRAHHRLAGIGRLDTRATARATDRRADPLGRAHRRGRLHATAQSHEQRRDRRAGSRARSHAAEPAPDDDHQELSDHRPQQHERCGAGDLAGRHRAARSTTPRCACSATPKKRSPASRSST